LPCDCHDAACHDLVMFLPISCHALVMLLSCYCHVLASSFPLRAMQSPVKQQGHDAPNRPV
jgi:hypothetical protein